MHMNIVGILSSDIPFSGLRGTSTTNGVLLHHLVVISESSVIDMTGITLIERHRLYIFVYLSIQD